MGKTSRPLTIVVFTPLCDWPEIKKLEEQGHTIVRLWDDSNADLILGGSAWLMDHLHRKYLPLALKAARMKKYGKPRKKAGKNEKDIDDDID